MKTLEEQLRRAFADFLVELARDQPWARENELVSLFAFGPLGTVAQPDAPLACMRQIAIECAVPQRVNNAPTGNAKDDVQTC